MNPDLSLLDDHLAEAGVDGYLVNADDSNSDQLYLTGFAAPDPFTSLYADGEVHVLVSGMEYGRAKKEGRADTVSPLNEYDHAANREEYGPYEGYVRTVASFLADHGVDAVSTPPRFPLALADELRDQGVSLTAERDGTIGDIRAVKTDEEVEHVRAAQDANEVAMAAAESLLAEAEVVDGVLHHGGEVLTSERIQEEIEVTLLGEGCSLDETIVACGADGADPHDRGSGPIEADELLVVDIFPRDKATKYHADMTRTFVRGDPTGEMHRRHEVTDEAREAALDAVEPGATGADVHDAVCDVYEEAGYATLRSDPDTGTGFIHSTGHGVGLDVHEGPSVSPSGDELEPGHVITIEPGLYDPAVGGVRIEDLVVVTEDGYENLTDYHYDLVV